MATVLALDHPEMSRDQCMIKPAAEGVLVLMIQVYCEMLPCTQKLKDLKWKPKGALLYLRT